MRLNVCPTSNVKLGRVAALREHPIRRLYDAGVNVNVNTDDPLIFGSSLSEEFLALFRAGVMTAAELDEVTARLTTLLAPRDPHDSSDALVEIKVRSSAKGHLAVVTFGDDAVKPGS